MNSVDYGNRLLEKYREASTEIERVIASLKSLPDISESQLRSVGQTKERYNQKLDVISHLMGSYQATMSGPDELLGVTRLTEAEYVRQEFPNLYQQMRGPKFEIISMDELPPEIRPRHSDLSLPNENFSQKSLNGNSRNGNGTSSVPYRLNTLPARNGGNGNGRYSIPEGYAIALDGTLVRLERLAEADRSFVENTRFG